MANNLLTVGDFNVIIVHWPGGAQDPNYVQSAANTRVVGLEIAYLINVLKVSLKIIV